MNMITIDRSVVQQALAFTMRDFASLRDFEAAKAVLHDNLRAALAQQDEPVQEPVAWLIAQRDALLELVVEMDQHEGAEGWSEDLRVKINAAIRAALAQQEEPQTIDEAMQQPRAMAQAYENGYKAGVAAEREACAQVCEARFMGDLNREDMEARRCAAAIRARGEQP